MMIYRRNVGHLPNSTIVGLLWYIVADAANFFTPLHWQINLMLHRRSTYQYQHCWCGVAYCEQICMLHQ